MSLRRDESATDPGEPPPPWASRVAAALRVTTGAPEPP